MGAFADWYNHEHRPRLRPRADPMSRIDRDAWRRVRPRCSRCCTTTSGPETPIRGSIAPTDRFRSAVQDAKIGPDKDIPHVTPTVIVKYITDLQLLGLL